MNALDTNVLVRFLVEDDEEQSRRAARLIERAIAQEERLYVPDVVMAELCWVLIRAYGLGKAELVPVLRGLLAARHLTFTSPDVLARALEAWERGKGDFADYLVRAHARAHGCERVATFDRALLKEQGFFAP